MSNEVDMADICELAHEITRRECKVRKIKFEEGKGDEVAYTKKAQVIFNQVYDLITNILDV